MQVDWETVVSYMMHHPRWFEDFTRRTPGSEHVGEYRAAMPGDWQLRRRGYWLIAEPPEVPLVGQGWKLHVSATSRNSAEVLRAALPVLRDAGVRFKFLMDPLAVREVNGKSYPRGSSGKFITVYPADEAEFHAVGEALTQELKDFDGPYLLSDRRFPGSRVVYYRYGGFTSYFRLRSSGIRELMIDAPDGSKVPDIRNPYWSVPDWARDPFGSETPVTADDTPGSTALAGGRYVVDSALLLSNRGGVYRGIDTETGADIVLREARPGVEVGPAGIDAVRLLRHEYDILTDLSDTGLFVRPIDFFTQWEHAYLVEEYVPGTPIGRLSITENPIYSLDPTPSRLTDYYSRFRGLWAQVAEAVAVCHERGIVLGDLSPTNIIVTPDDHVRIIDLESAFHEGVDQGAGLSTPGMVTRRALAARCGDRRTDYYALGGVILCCVLMCHQADVVEQDIPRQLFAEAAADLDLPAELVSLIGDLYAEDAPLPDAAVVRKRIEDLPFTTAWRRSPPLARPVTPEPVASARLHKRIEATMDSVADYLVNSADPHREDRLFPADLLVFETNPLSLAHGAYGSLYALHVLKGQIPDTFLGWTLQRSTAVAAMPPGLYYGTAGVAWAQSAMGYPELATTTLRGSSDHPLLLTEPGVLIGAAGHGMACLRLWRDTGLPEFLDRARAIGTSLGDRAVWDGGHAHWPSPDDEVPIGYGYGASGVAMFLLALHAATNDPATLDLGRAALDYDLSQGEYLSSGVLTFPAVAATEDSPTTMLRHYWDEGTAGILTTTLRYHEVTGEYRSWIDKLLPDVRRKYVAFPQLFHGASGIGNTLLDAYEFLGDPELLGDAERVAAAVLCNAVERPEGVVFPGEQTLRESADLATGSAGVALFLDRFRRTAPGARTNLNFVLDDLLVDRR
ncbi:class III lanthionine synthetase LanKC [Kibdelosporangium persicum]|uniref:Serine/threonine protein kinase n=1 Tax=Kibdelosporangium persicum TaxID=2698649 RepID=A0ABX2FAU9_9PSEU|nr:class III lanthionine synthetase LanKC [Kibdelosporangium persicum]NRN67903.1 Serine/threonine protein kinase [Kibdelosporangium persicum]